MAVVASFAIASKSSNRERDNNMGSWPEAWAKYGNTTHYAPVDFRKDLETSSTYWMIQEGIDRFPENRCTATHPTRIRNLAYDRIEQQPDEAEGIEFLGRSIEGRSYPSGSYSETSGYAYFNGKSWYKDANWDSSSKRIEWFRIVDLDARNEEKERYRFPGHKFYKG